ncbi:MAG TPA: hypothetical protein VIY48_08420 [Candidatus Paceibacterota bacterium]
MIGQIQMILNVIQPDGSFHSGMSCCIISDEIFVRTITEDALANEALKSLVPDCLRDVQRRACLYAKDIK